MNEVVKATNREKMEEKFVKAGDNLYNYRINYIKLVFNTTWNIAVIKIWLEKLHLIKYCMTNPLRLLVTLVLMYVNVHPFQWFISFLIRNLHMLQLYQTSS